MPVIQTELLTGKWERSDQITGGGEQLGKYPLHGKVKGPSFGVVQDKAAYRKSGGEVQCGIARSGLRDQGGVHLVPLLLGQVGKHTL